jgi:hypothetical protein
MLTVNNYQQVVAVLMGMLGGRRFTTITMTELDGMKPEIRAGQVLKDPIKPYYHSEFPMVSFSIHDDYGLWCIHSDLEENRYDPDFKNPYFEFEGDRVTIRHRSGSGNLLSWTFILEGPVRVAVAEVIPEEPKKEFAMMEFPGKRKVNWR